MNEILEALGLRAKPSPGTNQYTKREVVGVTVSPTIGDASDPAPPPKTTADLAAEIGLSERSAQRRNEILEALGLRAKVGQGRPAKNGEIISPFFGDEPDSVPPPKTTADLAVEMREP